MVPPVLLMDALAKHPQRQVFGSESQEFSHQEYAARLKEIPAPIEDY